MSKSTHLANSSVSFVRCLLFFLIPIGIYSAEFNYSVRFLGLSDSKALKALKASSDLVSLQDRPPASTNALRFRVESDIPQMIEVLHSFGYYDAVITSDIENVNGNITVYVFIHSGPQYLLESYDFFTSNCGGKMEISDCKQITLKKLGIQLQKPVFAENIVDSQKNLLFELASCGYPLALISKKEIIADALTKTIRVKLCVETGPLCRFGPVVFIGIKDVKTKYIARKILWEEGDVYDESLVQRTQKRLIETELFSSVLISHPSKLNAKGELPLKIRFAETKHRSISAGVSYATIDGPGLSLAWVNRNFRKMGEYLGCDFTISKIYTAGVLTYSIPDFMRMDQTYIWDFQVARENIRVYLAQIYTLTNRLERKYTERLYGSYGVLGEYISVNNSIDNGKQTLVGLPIYFRYTHVKSILDPLKGFILGYKITPYQEVNHDFNFFVKQIFSGSMYVPLSERKDTVFAFRVQLGSIAGTGLNGLPMTKRFFGGSDENLRGYRFKTVSPLNGNGDPIGGRGIFYWTCELRHRLTENFGVVGFTDFGNVTSDSYPTVYGKWFKSVGAGLRYYLFFGPLRLDVGIPLNRRSFDPHYRIYASVGQTF